MYKPSVCIHCLYTFFVVIEVWQPRSEIRAKTVKTRLLGSSLSSSLPSAAILVSERPDKIFQIFVHIYADFFPPAKLMNNM